MHTPGHTVDHLCLWDPETGTLLTGDHVLPSITPHVSGVRKADSLKSYLATLDLVAQLDGVKLGLPAHGHPFADVPGRVDAIKEHHDERMELLRQASLGARARDGAAALARGVPEAALGRDGRERDVRPPRAHGARRRGRALARKATCSCTASRRERRHDAPETDTIADESVDLLAQLIRNQCVNDGTPSPATSRAASTCSRSTSATPASTSSATSARPGRENLVARIEGSDPTAPTLLLMGHTDVVPVNPDGWRRDPFGGELVDGEVWGRGAVDMLNLTATMAVAFRDLARSGFTPRGTLVYLAVADEENLGTWGAEHLLEHERDAVMADYVVTEAGGFQMPTPTGPRLPVIVGGEGHVLVPHHGARHARPRVAAVPHRQRARDRGRGRAPARRVPAADA